MGVVRRGGGQSGFRQHAKYLHQLYVLYTSVLVSVYASVCIGVCVCVCGGGAHSMEMSTDQVIKPVNVEALFKWVDHVPADVRHDIRKIAPMLSRLGYDPDAYPPEYGQTDANNTLLVEQTEEYWHSKVQQIFSMRVTKRPSTPSTNRSSDSEDDTLLDSSES